MAAIHAKNTLHAIWRQNIVNNLTSKKWVEQEKLQSQQPIYKKNINNNNNKILLSFLFFLSLLYIFTNNVIAYKYVCRHTITPVADTNEQMLCLKQHEGTMVASNVGTSATIRNITMENDTSTKVNMNALAFEVNSTVTTEVDSVTDASYDTSNINVGTSATIRNITNGNDASTNKVDMNALAFEINSATGTNLIYSPALPQNDIIKYDGYMDKCMNDNKILEVCGDLAGTKYYGYYSTIFMSQGKYWHHDGNFFIFDPGGDTNNIYILLFFHLFH